MPRAPGVRDDDDDDPGDRTEDHHPTGQASGFVPHHVRLHPPFGRLLGLLLLWLPLQNFRIEAAACGTAGGGCCGGSCQGFGTANRMWQGVTIMTKTPTRETRRGADRAQATGRDGEDPR
eukprot:6339562-Prymnesium_polylepis.1